VSKRCYQEAFEPMILTGLFAPGAECSAAAAMGMAYFFVMAYQNAFDVRWCKGNIGERIFDPWVNSMEGKVHFQTSTRVHCFNVTKRTDGSKPTISSISCIDMSINEELVLEADKVIFAVGAAALNAIVRNSPELSSFSEFRRFSNLRGTSVLATRLYLDRKVHTPYTANACWGFDAGVGMTMFNIGELHGIHTSDRSNGDQSPPGSIIEVDYYYADSLLVMSDDDLVSKVKTDLNTILGVNCAVANVVDAAVVRLPKGVNWYYPGSYKNMPDVQSSSLGNAFFAGDLVRTRHGSWSQEKAFVAGMEAANLIQGKAVDSGIIALPKDELHVAIGRSLISTFQSLLGGKKGPFLFDFLF
jgi:uncharacterized protein with NAD-binding domain and iron-sulfur cluster